MKSVVAELANVEPALPPASTAASEEPTTSNKPFDAYERTEDGHIVSHDGFIVPASFEEFYERYPRYVRGFVCRRWRGASSAEIEDRESELLIFLMTLPEDSKFRLPGFNGFENGCKDRIQAFDPKTSYGATAARFFNYLNLCLMNHFCTLSKQAGSNPIRRYNVLSLYSSDNDGNIVDEEYIYLRTCDASYELGRHSHIIEAGMVVDAFIAFVRQHNPELIVVIQAIQEHDTFIEAQRSLDMTENLFLRARNRLVVLHKAFEQGTEPPRQRKVYRARAPKAQSMTMAPAVALAL